MKPSMIRRVLPPAGALIVGLALTLTHAPTATAAGTPTPREATQAVLDDGAVAGTSVTVVTSSSVDFSVTTDEQPDGGALRVGSVSKGVAGALADALVQERMAALDEPVGTYLPEVIEPYRSLTLEQLLTHTTGLPHDVTVTDSDRPEATARSILDDLPVDPALGSGYRYSSLNYILVQAVVEARSGTSYDEAIKRHLGADTLRADCAMAVQRGRVPFFAGDIGASATCDGGGYGYGYLAGDRAALIRWAQWNLSSDGRDFHERSQEHSVEVREGQRYGFGWNYGTSDVAGVGRATVSHPGAVPGTYTLLKLVPSLDTAVVVTIPSYGELRAEETVDVADRAATAALGDTPGPPVGGVSTGTVILGGVSAAVLAAFAGIALQVRRIVRGRPRRGWRVGLALCGTVIAWVGLAIGVPTFAGVDVSTLATWAPDLALLAVVLVASTTMMALLSWVQRGRLSA